MNHVVRSTGFGLVTTLAFSSLGRAQQPGNFDALPDDITRLIHLRSQIPGDFFSPAVGRDERTPQRLQHDFDIYSWETFIALVWPLTEDGKPKQGNPTEEGFFEAPFGTVWESWMPAEAVFRENAEAPIEWGKQLPTAELYGSDWQKLISLEGGAAEAFVSDLESASKKKPRSISDVGLNPTASTHDVTTRTTKTLKEVEQAIGTGRLIDRSGYFVRYEVMLNEAVYAYICSNHLYDRDQQERYARDNRIVFPIGRFEEDPVKHTPKEEDLPAWPPSEKEDEKKMARRAVTETVGSIVVKAAWKVLTPKELNDNRFYRIRGVTQLAGGKEGTKTLCDFGLVGLHIIHKSADVAQWTWSTFEHDDNCPDVSSVAGETKQYSFFDPSQFADYQSIPDRPGINELSDLTSKRRLGEPLAEPIKEDYRSQLIRIVPLTRDVAAINRQFKMQLAHTVWKNYSLIITQWPLEPAGVFLGKGEVEQSGLAPGRRYRAEYGRLDGDVERYNKPPFALDERRLPLDLRDMPTADRQLGFPAPRVLANSVIETPQQGRISFAEDGSPVFQVGFEHGTSSCMHCHGDAKAFGSWRPEDDSKRSPDGSGPPSDMSFLLSRAKSKAKQQ